MHPWVGTLVTSWDVTKGYNSRQKHMALITKQTTSITCYNYEWFIENSEWIFSHQGHILRTYLGQVEELLLVDVWTLRFFPTSQGKIFGP